MQLHPILKSLTSSPLPPTHFFQQNLRIGKSLIDGNLWILGTTQPDLNWLQFKSIRSPKILTTIPILFSKLNHWIGSLKLSLSPQIQHALFHFLSSHECEEEKVDESITAQIQRVGIQNFFPSHSVNQISTPVNTSDHPHKNITPLRREIFFNWMAQISMIRENKFFKRGLKQPLLSWGGVLTIFFLIFWFAT